MGDNPTYSKNAIQVADYILANPLAKRGETMATFGEKWRRKIAPRSFDRIWKKAKEYNEKRIKKEEKAKDEVLIAAAKQDAENALKSREFFLAELQRDFEQLGKRKAGDVFKTIDKETGQVNGWLQAEFNDEIAAKNARSGIFVKLAGAMGWNAPTKQEIDLKQPILNIVVESEELKIEIDKL